MTKNASKFNLSMDNTVFSVCRGEGGHRWLALGKRGEQWENI